MTRVSFNLELKDDLLASTLTQLSEKVVLFLYTFCLSHCVMYIGRKHEIFQ